VGETRNVTIGVTCESKHDRCSHEVERRVIAASGHDQVTVLRLCHPPGSAYAPKPIAVVWRVWRPSLRLRSRSMRRVVGVILVLALGGCRERRPTAQVLRSQRHWLARSSCRQRMTATCPWARTAKATSAPITHAVPPQSVGSALNRAAGLPSRHVAASIALHTTVTGSSPRQNISTSPARS